MITRKTKVVPPVTPRIVPADPGPRALRYGLLVCAFLGTAWSSYEYGRTQAPGSGEETATQSGELQQRFAALQRERDALEEQLTDLQQVLEQDQRNLAAQRARSRVLQQSQTAPRQSPAAEPQSEPETPPTEQAAADHALTLENVRIAGTESENLFRLAFSVTRDRDDNERVTGTIWIAVNGTSGGKPTRLSLKSLSPQRRSFVTMGFTQQQEVTEELVLPDDFLPRNILIEAKPYGDRYTGTSESFDWSTGG